MVSDIPAGDGKVAKLFFTVYHMSRQSDRLSLQSCELGLPAPSPASECCPPPPLWFRGERHTRFRKKGPGEPIRTKGQTLWYSRYSIIPPTPLVSTVQCNSIPLKTLYKLNSPSLLPFLFLLLLTFQPSPSTIFHFPSNRSLFYFPPPF